MTKVWVIGLPGRGKEGLAKNELRKIEQWGSGMSECRFVELPAMPANATQLSNFQKELERLQCSTILLEKKMRPIEHLFGTLSKSVRVLRVDGPLMVLTGFDEWGAARFTTCQEGVLTPFPKEFRPAA